MSSNRNRPCPCGSGKKYKHCCINKKEKFITLNIDLGRSVYSPKISINSKEGVKVFDFLGQEIIPLSAKLETFYKGQNKDRILSSHNISPNQLLVDPNFVYQGFDKIFAIDTNNRNFGEIAISLASVILAKPIKTQVFPNKTGFHYAFTQCFEFHNLNLKPENQAWKFLIDGIISHPQYKGEKIGIFVDSDLGNLAKINERKIALIDSFFLPENFSLIYGRDKKEENLANLLINACHKQSTFLLDCITKNYSEENLFEAIDKPYSHFRIWNLEENTEQMHRRGK